MYEAARFGDLDIVKYLREIGCELGGPWTCRQAAHNGRLEILKWLRDHGCPWDSATPTTANYHEHWDILKYAIDNGCPGSEEYADKLPPEYRA
jgi:hypothetical protein